MEDKVIVKTCKTCSHDIHFFETDILTTSRLNNLCPMCTGIIFTDREYRDLRNQIKVKRIFRKLKFW